MTQIRQFSTYKLNFFGEDAPGQMHRFCEEHNLTGMEIFMSDVKPRTETLFNDASEKDDIVDVLNGRNVKRLHCSYWACPTSFLTKNNFGELVGKFGSTRAVSAYYGDLTGDHMFARWIQEYEVACAVDAQAYVFHLIDYGFIDGKWEYTIPKHEIRQAMVYMIQQLITRLLDKNLLSDTSPRIEIENAGWGLEHGIQTAEDYQVLFGQLFDPYRKVRIAWDFNHLLHAIGFDEQRSVARFFLPESEVSDQMRKLETTHGNDPALFAHEWVRMNVLHPELVDHLGSLHLSDCRLKRTEFFANGKLTGELHADQSRLGTLEEQGDFGLNIVLSHYDSHDVVGEGILNPSDIRTMIQDIRALNPAIVVLHELKNSVNQHAALKKQLDSLELDKGPQ